MKRMKTSKRFRIYKEVRRELNEHYPNAFPRRGTRPPLKIGIIKDIINDNSINSSRNELRVFLSIWTRSTSYLKSISKERPRVTLSGEMHSEVLKKHAKDANKQIKMRKNKQNNGLTSNS